MKLRSVKIKKSKKNDIKKSGYFAVFGNETIADLFRKVQSTTIRNGNELQKLISKNIKFPILSSDTEIDEITKSVNSNNCFYIPNYKVSKSQFEESGFKLSGKNKIDIDAIFAKDGVLYIIEYKQGDNLDTKKSQSEVESLSKLSEFFISKGVKTSPKLVMWVCDDVKNSSIKTTEGTEFLCTGKEASDILEISFDKIEKMRSFEQEDNIDFLIEEFNKIKSSLGK
jgi:hypothetical protein